MTRYLPGLALVLAASLCPTTGQAQSQAPSRDQTTYLDFQVEQPAKVKTVKTPVYPDHLRASQVEGRVLVQFVVDERGRPDMSSFKVIKSSDAALTANTRLLNGGRLVLSVGLSSGDASSG